eukprot:1160360-Pelagomonas_calceolata.AAC.12
MQPKFIQNAENAVKNRTKGFQMQSRMHLRGFKCSQKSMKGASNAVKNAPRGHLVLFRAKGRSAQMRSKTGQQLSGKQLSVPR